jgi:hypothetical protein
MKRKKMSAGKSRFKGRIKENAKKRKRGSAYGYLIIPQGVEVFNPEPDTTVKMDIMPYEVTDKKHPDSPIAEVGELWYKRPFKIHRDVGVDNDKEVCLTSFGKKCPICEYRTKLLREDGDKKEADALKPSNRNLYAIIIKGKKGEDKVHLFDFSDHNFQKVFEEQLADLYPDEFEVFPDHQEGYTVAVVFAEDSFMGYKFAKPTRFDFLERKEQYEDDILDSVPKLDECLAVLSYEELRAKFFEIEEDDDEEEEEQPVRKPRKPKVEEPEEEEDEPEDEDDEEENEDDYEEEEDEDDDDDEEEEEEEEEPEPPKRKRKVSSTTRRRR